MPDPRIYLVVQDGQPAGLFRSTDPRLVRRHIIDNLPRPEIEVRPPTTEEAMNMALDGVAVIDLSTKTTLEPDMLEGVPPMEPKQPSGDTTPEPSFDPPAASIDDPGVDHPRFNSEDDMDVPF
jgi:hypothetical protein